MDTFKRLAKREEKKIAAVSAFGAVIVRVRVGDSSKSVRACIGDTVNEVVEIVLGKMQLDPLDWYVEDGDKKINDIVGDIQVTRRDIFGMDLKKLSLSPSGIPRVLSVCLDHLEKYGI